MGAVGALALGLIAWRLLTLGPDPARARELHEEAKALHAAGKTSEAIDRIKSAIANDPESIAIHRDYHSFMRQANRLQEVRDEYRRRAEKLPKSAAAQYLAARLEEDTAIEAAMKRVLEIDAQYVWAHRALAYYYGDRRREDALRHFHAALASPQAEPDDARDLLITLYRWDRLEEIDQVLAGWEKATPAFARQEIPLGKGSNGVTVHLSFALDPDLRYLWAIRITRDADRSFRQITVRRHAQKYVVGWTRAWVAAGQDDQQPEEWEHPDRPSFTEIHGAAMSRLTREENP